MHWEEITILISEKLEYVKKQKERFEKNLKEFLDDK